jgi:diguanylate cyclase (GGDEF)-like protein
VVTSPPAACDVLYVGSDAPPELDELAAGGRSVGRTGSLVSAIERLRAAAVRVVVVEAGAVSGAETERLGALRDAGAATILALYPAALSWRTSRALFEGADASLALPLAPGVLGATVALLTRIHHADGTSVAPVEPPRTRVEALLNEVATMNRAIEDVDRLLDQVHGAFERQSDAERCSLLLVERRGEGLVVRRATRVEGREPPPPEVPPSGLAARVARTGVPLVVPEIGRAPREVAECAADGERAYRTGSCLLLPLRGSDEVVGVICLADRRDGSSFDDADVPPLAFLAGQAGQAIENALKFRQLQQLATVDELTGLANRRQFRISLEREVQRARRYERQLTFCLLDLDHFKQYNDRCGHQAGDRALAKVGEILRTSLREVDVVARYGGEEFAVILPETAGRPAGDSPNPFPFLERLRKRIEETPFEGEEKIPGGKLTVSGGVACFPDDAESLDDLVREADRALYVSKGRGRNTLTYRDRPLAG